MRRKRRGESLIVVIIVFMFLLTILTAMLSMILGNYKARIAESKRVENLYASDSGLDVTYNVIGKNFDAAVKYGYYEVAAMKNNTNRGPNNGKYADINEDIRLLNLDINKINTEISDAKKQHDATTNLSQLENEKAKKRALINEDEEIQQVLINEEFKRAFNNFIQKIDANPDISASGDENIPTDQLNKLIIDHSYIDMSKVNITNINQDKPEMTVNFGIKDKEGHEVSPKFEPVEISAQNIACDSEHTVKTDIASGHYIPVEIHPFLKQGYYNIAVASSFYSEKLTGNDNDTSETNERQLKANFKLSVPEYNDIYNGEAGGAVQKYLATQDRAITVNGNMNLSKVNGFSVNNGGIYVGGTTPSAVQVSNRSYEKYSGGMMIYDSSNVKFDKDVVTRNTLNLRSGANVTIGGNLYGRNIYVGGDAYDSSDLNNPILNQPAKSADLSVNKVVIDNDLGLKAINSNVTINDFFGINDKNITAAGNPIDAYGKPVDRTKSSSSIIVNSNDDSSNIIIQKSAYIMGTAHINTNETDTDSSNEYQTGESGAVKGNYIAYTVPLDDSEKLVYYNPLQLLDEPDVIKKATHFFDYWSAKINKGIYPHTGGIQLPITENSDGTVDTKNIHTAGALVYQLNGKKRVVGSTYNLDLEAVDGPVYNAQAEFASKVYRFDQSATKPFDYDKTKVTDFGALVDTSKIASSGYTLQNQNNNGEHAIFNGDNKLLRITKSDGNTDEIISNTDNNTIEIKVAKKDEDKSTNNYTLKGVIVSAGDVSIDSNITINGCLIVGGDLNINGQNNITVNYDQGVIERVEAKNTGLFKTVFGQILVDDTDDTSNNNSTNLSSNNITDLSASDSASVGYDLKYFLEKKLWQIIK